MSGGLLKGRRIHFAGSADDTTDLSRLRYAHDLIRELAVQTFREGGGVVVTLGFEPVHKTDLDLPLIFDWTVLEAFEKCQCVGEVNWPASEGASIVAVGFANWRDKITVKRKPLWTRITSSKSVELIQIREELKIGGVLRERQAIFGDILVAIGGGPGVQHLADLYVTSRKPIVPIDIPLKEGRQGAAETLAEIALQSPQDYLRYRPLYQAAAAYSALSIGSNLQNIDEFAPKFLNFVSHLPCPQAFLVRLQDKDAAEFEIVESFFRNVVDDVLRESGYERFEVGVDTDGESFLNVEIFRHLHFASLVIVDLTGLRPNCFTELGYALGCGKKVIMTAQKGTRIPFDTASIPCFFWLESLPDSERKKTLREFMRININRRPLVRSTSAF